MKAEMMWVLELPERLYPEYTIYKTTFDIKRLAVLKWEPRYKRGKRLNLCLTKPH